MMQKLQEESSRTHSNLNPSSTSAQNTPTLAKSARQIAESLLDAGGSNGFLDNIIRSSLDSGVPGHDDKSSKEDKNLAPENMSNKALLDQLCRNSRLTPLPKSNLVEPSSPVLSSHGDDSYSRKGSSPLNLGSSLKEDSSNQGDSSPKFGSPKRLV